MVLSAHPRSYSEQNAGQLESIPPDLVVCRAFALDAKHHLGYKGRYLSYMALPDRWNSWFFGAVPAGLSLIRRYKPQVIWSTFPISSAHAIGLALHRITGLPWIADFRDPMLQLSYPSSRMQRGFFRWIERQAIMRCHTAVFTTHNAMQDYCRRFPDISPAKFRVIENGYDEEAFRACLPQVSPQAWPKPGTKRVTLLHSGVLYQDGRDPTPFLMAMARLKAQGLVHPDTLRVVLRAPGDEQDMQARVDAAGVTDLVEVGSPVSYNAAIKEMLDADGLMVFQGSPFNSQIPAKIYEYFRARKPIIGLLDPEGETARVLTGAGFGDFAHIDLVDDIVPALQRFLENIHNSTATIASEDLIRSASRQHRALELADVFDTAASTTAMVPTMA